MQAVVFHGHGKWNVEATPKPLISADDDVLLKVDRASICGTDIHILSLSPRYPVTRVSCLCPLFVETVVDGGAA